MNLQRNQTGEGWVVFFTFPSSSLSVFRCVSSRGGDEDDDLTGPERMCLGITSGGVCLRSLSLSLFGCIFRKFIDGKIRV